MHSAEIRQKFLDFFQSKDHAIKPSSLLIPPPDDPTLLFTTAGMVQFKPLWAGAPLSFKRAASVQKCLRAGGKGSDLENVGKTLRHHTFFEMLGNFSFGDYFKKEAILWAWEFLIDVLKMPKKDIWVSVYEDDDEAYNIWKNEVGIDSDKIIRLGEKDNFWGPAGVTGACGPSSEIYYDLGPKRGCGKKDCRPGCDCERYIEFWNLVFPQFYQNEDGTRKQLERRGIDTGMGLERLTFLLQEGANNNYETDLFKPIVDKIKNFTSVQYKDDDKSSFHVIADHSRALTFAFSENIMPSNEGRGYVLRRLLRRAVRHGRKIDITEPFLYKLVDTVVSIMKEPYPELIENIEHTKRIILSEEERFQHTIDYGLYMFSEISEKLEKKKQKTISGEEIFKLYDTYGFPLDLLTEVAAEKGLTLDYPGFEKLMNEQKERARLSWVGTEKAVVNPVYAKIKPQEFVGYNTTRINAKVIAVLDGEVFIEKTPFYAESGGQVGDTGILVSRKGEAEVIDTQRIMPGIISHKIKIKSGKFDIGDEVEAAVNEERRLAIARHHTATHILQYCLRETLGDHVKQCGSLVAPHKLRFDFTHFANIEEEELLRIEKLVNEKIVEDSKVDCYELPLQSALKKGVLAFFGEKYGENVRVLNIGGYSKELCGGTHIDATGKIGLFRITSESSIAAGVRRIEAVCGTESLKLINEEKNRLDAIYELLKTEPKNAVSRIKDLLDEHKKLSKEKEEKDKGSLILNADKILSNAKVVKGIKIVTANMGNVRSEHLRSLSDALKDKIKSGIIVLGSVQDEKANLIAVVTQDLVDKGYHAGRIIKETAKIVEGTGGGKPNIAQAGGRNPSLLDKALQEVGSIIGK